MGVVVPLRQLLALTEGQALPLGVSVGEKLGVPVREPEGEKLRVAQPVPVPLGV